MNKMIEMKKDDWVFRTLDKWNYGTVCTSVVKSLFTIPAKAQKITFHLTDKPTPQSYRCVWNGIAIFITLSNGTKQRETTTYQFDQYFHINFPELEDKPFYVSVYY